MWYLEYTYTKNICYYLKFKLTGVLDILLLLQQNTWDTQTYKEEKIHLRNFTMIPPCSINVCKNYF
jgi:hypothetical protein